MQIRQATITDAPVIHALGQSVYEFSVNDQTVTFWPQEVLLRAIQSDDVLVLVTEEESITGFIIVNCNRGLDKALIENIYVTPEYRGQQIGDALLLQALTRLKAMGYAYIATLIPSQANAAADLYERNGFSKGEQFVWLDISLKDSFKKQ